RRPPRAAQARGLARCRRGQPYRWPALERRATRRRSPAAHRAGGRALAGLAPGRLCRAARSGARPGRLRLPPGQRIGDPGRSARRRRPGRAEAAPGLRHGLWLLCPATHPARPPGRQRLTAAPHWRPAMARDPRHPADLRRPPAEVVLLSAGPGDLELLTLKAVRALQQAEVLLLDELVDPGIVELARQARVVRVGKRGGCRSTPQAFICRLMRRYALQGLRVVRVKGGEALMFGRAGEEIAFLREAGVPVRIINGGSAAFAAAAALGVSLTHRQ